EPLTMLGLRPGDAKILRNAGARVTDDTLRTLVLAVYLLGVERVLIMPHTKCKMASVSGDDEVHDLIRDQYGVDTRSLEFHTDNDQLGALRHDLERVRHHPLLPDGLPVAGALYDVDTGKLEIVDQERRRAPPRPERASRSPAAPAAPAGNSVPAAAVGTPVTAYHPRRGALMQASTYETFAVGRSYFDLGDPIAAARVLEPLADREPESRSILELLGRSYFHSAQLTKAER